MAIQQTMKRNIPMVKQENKVLNKAKKSTRELYLSIVEEHESLMVEIEELMDEVDSLKLKLNAADSVINNGGSIDSVLDDMENLRLERDIATQESDRLNRVFEDQEYVRQSYEDSNTENIALKAEIERLKNEAEKAAWNYDENESIKLFTNSDLEELINNNAQEGTGRGAAEHIRRLQWYLNARDRRIEQLNAELAHYTESLLKAGEAPSQGYVMRLRDEYDDKLREAQEALATSISEGLSLIDERDHVISEFESLSADFIEKHDDCAARTEKLQQTVSTQNIEIAEHLDRINMLKTQLEMNKR